MASRNSTLRPSSSAGWLGSLATPNTTDLRFSTFAVTGAKSSPRRKLGAALFEEDVPVGRESAEDELRELRGLEGAEQGWVVTVAEGPKARSRSRKPDPTLTVYVSTPTSSLTLARKLSEIVDLEARLRAQFPDRLPQAKSTAPPPMPKKRNTVLASLTRTLSPRRGGTPSFSSKGPTSSVDLKDLGATLSAASLDGSIRAHAAWGKFFVVRRDDLESAHVERRIKRARSDQTMHLAPVPLRDVRQEPSATETVVSVAPSGATEEIVDSAGDATRVLAVLGDGNAKIVSAALPSPPLKEDIELDTASQRREGSSGSTAMDMSCELAPPDHLRSADVPSPVLHAEPLDAAPASVAAAEPTSIEEPDVPVDATEETTGDGEISAQASAAAADADHAHPRESLVLAPAMGPPSLAPSSSMSVSVSMTRSASNVSATTTISKQSRAITLDSFDILRVLGKGCAGKVLLVKKKGTSELYALKAITKRHVLAHRELAHTRTEQAILKKCAKDQSNPFVVKLHYSFHDHDTLYLTLDFHPGGDLATQLARWGRLGRDRARFYISEIIDGVAGLHHAGVIYRDLKPENILISASGHVVLTDFGLSKDFGWTSTRAAEPPKPHWLGQASRSASTPPSVLAFLQNSNLVTSVNYPCYTSTFCGTSEYLSPEVLLGQKYTFSTDWFSAGTLLYEMLAGTTPFYADNHAAMYRRVLYDELTFDDSSRQFDDDTKSLLRGMLQRDPAFRITHSRMVRHPYFAMISWEFIRERRYQPPFVPTLNPDDPTDTSQFEDMFLSLPPQVKGEDPASEPGADRDPPQGEPQPAFDEDGRDVFDGYSYFGRDSASIHRQEVLADEDEADYRSEPSSYTSDDGDDVDQAQTAAPDVEPTANEDAVLAISSEATSLTSTPSLAPVGNFAPEPSALAPLTEADSDRLLSSTPPPAVNSLDHEETDLDATLTSIADDPTVKGAAVLDVFRPRQLSSRSNLEPLPEEHPTRRAPTTEIVVEEAHEDMSDSEWDVVDRADVGGFVRNGGREATLWQRGFRDRYRLVLAPLASPLRPPSSTRRLGLRQNSRLASSSSEQSSQQVSPAMTPEPPASPRPGLYAAANGIRSAPATPRVAAKRSKQSLAPSTASSQAGGAGDVFGSLGTTPRKAGQAFRKFAKSAFLSTSSNKT